MKYFTHQKGTQTEVRSPASRSLKGDYSQLLTFSAGAFLNSKSYQWTAEEIEGWSLQLEYRKSGPGDFFAKAFQLELQKFEVGADEISKLSLLYSLVFPSSSSFPVYIGAAAGPGFFLTPVQRESFLTFDYKGFLGVRISQSHSQFFLESGIKNHLHVLSDGQFIAWFVSSGVSYKF